MTPEKIKANIEKLRSSIARKPKDFTPEYASSIEESFSKYTRTSTINLWQSFNEVIMERKWPFPLYALKYTWPSIWAKCLLFLELFVFILIIYLSNFIVRIFSGLMSLINQKNSFRFDKKSINHYSNLLEKTLVSTFRRCRKNIFNDWMNNPIFEDKKPVIEQIVETYEKGLWVACITTAYPLVDHLIRNYFQTREFEKDVTYTLRMLKRAGIGSEHLKPGYIAQRVAKEKGEENHEEAVAKDLRLIGIALGSFHDIGSIYYSYYRKESPINTLNRHAIIHGASHFNSEEDAIKLITFIDLTLRLEPAFQILLKEQ